MDIKAKKKMTKEAREFISKKIKFLMEEEGMEQKQAIAVAYSMAEKEGYKVPKKTKASSPKDEVLWDIVLNGFADETETYFEYGSDKSIDIIYPKNHKELSKDEYPAFAYLLWTSEQGFRNVEEVDSQEQVDAIIKEMQGEQGEEVEASEIESKKHITEEWLNEEWDLNYKSFAKLVDEGKLKIKNSKAVKDFVNYKGKDEDEDEDEENELIHEFTGEFLHSNDIDAGILTDTVYDSLMECVEMYVKRKLKGSEEIESKDIITEHILGMFQEYAEKVCANNKDIGFDEIREMWAKEDKDKIVSFLYEKNKAQELVIDKLDGILASCGITLNEFDINNIIAADPPAPTTKPPAGQKWTKSVKDDGTVEWVLTKI